MNGKVHKEVRRPEDTAKTGDISAEEMHKLLAAQQKSMDAAPGWKAIDVNTDGPVLQARQLMQRLIAGEANL